ncbi:extracellular solute-binding protein [Haloferax sp. YSMS24]|uniref:extracellular solute-binding protein n=1 Tax=Haloferax sp. YSMS24 TaxID=3388425 RepID=UPI00398CFDD1
MVDKRSHLPNRREYMKGVLGAGLLTGLAGCTGNVSSGNDTSEGGSGDSTGGDSGGSTGEGSGSGNSENWKDNADLPITWLTWNHGHFSDWLPDWSSAFEEEHGVEAKWLDRPADQMVTFVQSRFQSGNPPNAIDMQSTSWVSFVDQGGFVPLDDLFSDERLDKIPKATREFVTYNGKLYGFPHFQNMGYQMHNRPLYDELGMDEVPRTTKEVFDTAERYVDETEAEFGLTFLRYGFGLWQFFANEDIPLVENGQAGFNTDRTVEILERLRQLTDDGVIPEITWTSRKEGQASNFGAGKTGMALFQGSLYRNVESAGGDWVTPDALLMENFEGAPFQVHAFFISATGDDATVTGTSKFLEVAGNRENQVQWQKQVPNPVSRTDVLDEFLNDDKWGDWRESNPLLVKQTDIMTKALEEETLFIPPRIPGITEAYDVLSREFTNAALGEQSAEKAVSNAASEMNSIIQ